MRKTSVSYGGVQGLSVLVVLIGCTPFVDKTSMLVFIQLLQLVEDLEKVHTYAWGAVALVYLY
ncbi:hypothetical protein Syun_013829 [Stephania yunnanensis]|uniref:Aminotransferase-like plant mobile domain-containing protein n=1 Tax=Stephania yunnanensis TaxID=152371 RepID=A0AAP0P911_9MAGN